MASEKLKPQCNFLDLQEFGIVFEEEAAAASSAIENHYRLEIKDRNLYVADHGIYTQGRTLAEVMFHCLYDPSITNSNIGNQRGYLFSNITIGNHGIFIYYQRGVGGSRPTIAAMPTVDDMVEGLQGFGEIQGLIFFPKYVGSKKPAWDLLRKVLNNEAKDPDSVLESICKNYTTNTN